MSIFDCIVGLNKDDGSVKGNKDDGRDSRAIDYPSHHFILFFAFPLVT